MTCRHCGTELDRTDETQVFKQVRSKMTVLDGRKERVSAYAVDDLCVHYECPGCEAEYTWTRSTGSLDRTKSPVPDRFSAVDGIYEVSPEWDARCQWEATRRWA